MGIAMIEDKSKLPPQKLSGNNTIENLTLLIDECNKECEKRKRLNIEIKQNKNLLMQEGYVFYSDCEKLLCEECPVQKRRKQLDSDRLKMYGWGVGI